MQIHMKQLISKFASNRKWVIMSIVILSVLGTAAGVSAYELTKTPVTLVLNGEEQQVSSHAETVEELLVENDVDIAKYDLVEPQLDSEIASNMKVNWKPAQKVELMINGDAVDKWTTAETVQEVLDEENIEVKEYDKVEPSLKADIENGLSINFESAFQVNLDVGGKGENVWTTSITVADLLKQQGVKLGELDRVEPAKDEMVTKDTQVNIIRVEKVTDVVEESVDYAVVKRKNSDLNKGTEKVLKSGQKGKIEKHYEVVLENGKEVSRDHIKTETIQESSDRIVAVGTKTISQTVSRKAEPAAAKSKKEFYVSSTAYTANCAGCSGVTATGYDLNANPNAKVIAVDPSVIPLGTKVYVEGYGYAIASDTGGAIKGNKIDVFINSKSAATRWGRKTVKIKILE
jgi:uncharacterized protein YabE (DUF348 family)